MSDNNKEQLSYADCGVDIDAGNAFVGRIKNAVNSTMRPEVLAGLGGFGGLFQPDFSNMEEPVLVSGTDGVADVSVVPNSVLAFDETGNMVTGVSAEVSLVRGVAGLN